MINIGRIQGTHHLKGGVKLSSTFDDIYMLVDKKVILEKDDKTLILTITKISALNHNKYIVYFEGIDNIDNAREIVGYDVNIRRDLLPEPTEEEFYLSDLVDFKVYDDKLYVGVIVDYLSTPAHDILVVENDDKKEILIPFVDDVYIKNIDFDNEKVHVSLIEGIL